MAKRNKIRKKKKPQKMAKIKPANYIRQHARKSPIYECLIDKDWRESQFSPVFVSRKKASGRLILGTYVVDMQCLGVKDAWYKHDMELYEYKDFVKKMEVKMNQHFVKIDPMLCFNIIYGAVEFAEDCGFQPHKDFDISEYILDDVESIEYMEVPLGKDGKPFFVAGPFDDSAKIMATLSKNKGEGNFDFIAEINPDDHEFMTYEEHTLPNLPEIFPEAIIDEKLDSIDSDKRVVLHLQLNTAAAIMIKGKGNLAYIKEQFENNDDFFEDVLEEVLKQLEDAKLDGKKLVMSDEEYKRLENQTLWVLEKIIELEGPQFLWEEDYEPELTFPQNIENLNNEEWQALEKKKLFYMTREQQDSYLLGRVLLDLTSDYTDEQLASKVLQETLIEEYLEKLRTTVFKKRWDEEIKDYCLNIGKETFKKLHKAYG